MKGKGNPRKRDSEYKRELAKRDGVEKRARSKPGWWDVNKKRDQPLGRGEDRARWERVSGTRAHRRATLCPGERSATGLERIGANGPSTGTNGNKKETTDLRSKGNEDEGG